MWAPIDGVAVIGITGKARHGKDELARALTRLIANGERFAFSDALAAVARSLGGMTTRDPRVLQNLGTSSRERDPDVWVRCLYHAIEDRRPDVAIITGVRYPNEAAMIREMGGALVAVVRQDAPTLTDRDAAHPVEQGIEALVSDADAYFRVPELVPTEVAEYFDRLASELLSAWFEAAEA